jgi:hypothetical protein
MPAQLHGVGQDRLLTMQLTEQRLQQPAQLQTHAMRNRQMEVAGKERLQLEERQRREQQRCLLAQAEQRMQEECQKR